MLNAPRGAATPCDTARVQSSHSNPCEGHRIALSTIAEAFQHHDQVALQKLTDIDLRRQRQARLAVYQHARSIWEQAKADDLNPATSDDWTPVALICDLAMHLLATAHDMGSELTTVTTTVIAPWPPYPSR